MCHRMPVQCLSRCCLPCFALPAFHWKARASSFTVLPSRGPTCHVSPRVPSDRASLPPPWPSFASPLPSCYTLQTHSKVHISALSAKLLAVSRRLASKQSVHWKMSSWNKCSLRERRLGDCKKDPVFNLLYSRRLEHTLYITDHNQPRHAAQGDGGIR